MKIEGYVGIMADEEIFMVLKNHFITDMPETMVDAISGVEKLREDSIKDGDPLTDIGGYYKVTVTVEKINP